MGKRFQFLFSHSVRLVWVGLVKRRFKKKRYVGRCTQHTVIFSKRWKNNSLCVEHRVGSVISPTTQEVNIAHCFSMYPTLISVWGQWDIAHFHHNICGLAESTLLRATAHTRLRARDHHTSSTLIDGKGGAGPTSLHTTLEGPTEHVTVRWI